VLFGNNLILCAIFSLKMVELPRVVLFLATHIIPLTACFWNWLTLGCWCTYSDGGADKRGAVGGAGAAAAVEDVLEQVAADAPELGGGGGVQGHPMRLRRHLRTRPRPLSALHVPLRVRRRAARLAARLRLRPAHVPERMRNEDGRVPAARGAPTTTHRPLPRWWHTLLIAWKITFILPPSLF